MDWNKLLQQTVKQGVNAFPAGRQTTSDQPMVTQIKADLRAVPGHHHNRHDREWLTALGSEERVRKRYERHYVRVSAFWWTRKCDCGASRSRVHAPAAMTLRSALGGGIVHGLAPICIEPSGAWPGRHSVDEPSEMADAEAVHAKLTRVLPGALQPTG